MEKQEMFSDPASLVNQLQKLKTEFDQAIGMGKAFDYVKTIHLQIKKLSRLIEALHIKDADLSTRSLQNN